MTIRKIESCPPRGYVDGPQTWGTQFSDGNPYATAGDLSATLNWGDGNPSPPPAATIVFDHTNSSGLPVFDVIDTHAYEYGGQYSIQTTITDTDVQAPIVASTTTANTTISVADAPISASPVTQPVPTGVEGSSTGTLTVATFSSSNLNLTAANFSATIAWGDGTTSTGTVLPDGTLFEVQGSHTYTEDNIYTGSVTITDNSGSPMTTPTSATVPLTTTIYDAPLTAGAAVTVPTQTEGKAFTVEVGTFTDTNSFATDPNAYTVSINWGDGTSPSAGTVLYVGAATFDVYGTHTYAEEKPQVTTTPPSPGYAVTVQITDTDADRTPPPPASIPRQSTSTSTVITVADAPIGLVTATVPTQTEGVTANLTLATLTDTDPGGVSSDYQGTVNWGDGSSSALTAANFVPVSGPAGVATFLVQASHAYPQGAVYTATINVYDTDNGVRLETDPISAHASVNTTITVNAAPLTSVGPTQTLSTTPSGSLIYEGHPTGSIGVATFQSANPSAVPSDFSATINWGDGTTSAGTVQQGTSSNPSLFSLFNVFGTHTYIEEGSYPVTVTITDINVVAPITPSSTVATNTSIKVTDAPLIAVNSPTVTIPLTQNVNSGTVTVGQFIDEDPNGKGGTAATSDYYAVIFWGDGTFSTATGFVTTPTTYNGNPATLVNVLGNHTYATDGSYQITVLVYDTEGVQAPSSNLAAIFSTTAVVTA